MSLTTFLSWRVHGYQQDSTYVYCKHNIQREKRSIFAQLKPVISTVFSSEYIGGDPVHKQRSTELF